MGKTRRKVGWWLGATLALALGACGGEAPGGETVGSASVEPAAVPPYEDPGQAVDGGMDEYRMPLTEAQVLEVARLINQGEVDQGQLALQRATDADARAFAQQMVDAHSGAVQRLNALATQLGQQPTPSPLSEKLQAHGQQALASL